MRPFVDGDLPRLQGALARWIQDAGRCGYCHVGEIPHRIYENLGGRRPESELVQVWEDNDAIVGMAINLRFDRAFDVFASPELRGSDAELAMLRVAYETTLGYVNARGDGDRSVITDVFAGDDDRIALLTQLGFAQYRMWDYIVERDLSTPTPEPVPPDGFTIRTATLADSAGLARAKNDAFGHQWSAEHYRAQAMEKPGCAPEREVVVVSPEGEIAAFADVWLDGLNRVGHFEPVGTHSAFRRRGLARAAMVEGLRRMRAAGMVSATVEYDAENAGAAALYRGLGFTPKLETYGYRCVGPGTARLDTGG